MKKRTIAEAAHTIIEKHVFVKYACDPPKTPNTHLLYPRCIKTF